MDENGKTPDWETRLRNAEWAADHAHLFNQLRTGPSLDSALRYWSPPADVRVLFGVLWKTDSLDTFIGDLEERYGLVLKSQGRRAATIWFWREVALSFISLALDAVRRISGLEKLMRRIGS